MPSKTRVIVYGAGGYGGVGLVENLLHHPDVEISALVSREGAGAPLSQLYPHLEGKIDLTIEHADTFEPEGRGDFVFFSTPDGVGQTLARRYIEAGYRIVDFSGDFRFNDNETYRSYSAWQQGEQDHADPELLISATYGCPEFNREAISKSKLVGNPGCMAISCLLALEPAVSMGAVENRFIQLDVKTGISGAGKKPKPLFHFPAADGNAYAYKIGKHQHLYEIERHLCIWSSEEVKVNFTPHVIPAVRGIISTCTLPLRSDANGEDVVAAYHDRYRDEPFVMVHSDGQLQELIHVRGTNLCRLGVTYVERTHSLVVVSLIDNLQKGQSGNAVQVMNLMLGLPESRGMDFTPRYP